MGGKWAVRIDDIDPPREVPGAADQILRDIESLGLEWDGAVTYQSQRSDDYDAALAKLRDNGATFSCGCTRKQLGGKVYPGTCRNGLPTGSVERTIRVKVCSKSITFDDVLRGRQNEDLGTEVGDFVLRRADGFYAYHLAAVVDDARLGVSEIVRGADLLSSTARQIHLQQLLGFDTPRYCHLPVALNERGAKLSKQTFAAPIVDTKAADVLSEGLDFLGFTAPEEVWGTSPTEILAWAAKVWDIREINRNSREYLRNNV